MNVIGSTAILTVAQQPSTSLHTSVDYLSELPDKQECEIVGIISHLGRATAAATVELRVKGTGRLAARGSHVRLLASGLPKHRQKL